MMKRIHIGLLASLALLAGAACTRTERPERHVTLSFSIGAPATRAGETLAERVADGSAIAVDAGLPDIVVLIADPAGTVVAKYPDTDPDDTELTFDAADPTRASITFKQAALTAGSYTVYAFANTGGLWPFSDGTDGYTAATLPDIGTAEVLEALQFVPATFDPANGIYPNPALQNGRLPLSAKGQLTVTSSLNGVASLQLLRCVARVDAEFRNDYGADLDLTDLTVTFHHLNPGTGYILPHAADIPAGAEDGDLVETAAAFAIPDGQSKDLAAFVYPSEAPEGGKYTCDITFSFDADSDGTPETFSYTDLEVLDSRAVNIASLSRNQSLHVLIRIGKGQTLSFNFSVGEWTSLTETVLFE